MKPGLALVLTVLRGELPDASAPALTLALQTAENERILPWFVSRLRQTTLPPWLDLAPYEREASLSAFFYSSELKSLLRDFAVADLPVIPLKGPSFALRVFGSVALRPCRDLDLLVRRPDFPRAAALLTTLGFTPQERPDDYHQPFLRNTTLVELHFDIENPLALNFAVNQAWQRAVPGSFLGQPTLHLAPADELLQLALHGVHHRFDRLSYILDLSLAFERFAPALGPSLSAQGPAASLLPLAALGQQLTRHLGHHPTPPLKIPIPAHTEAHLRVVADRLWNTLLTQPARPMNWQQKQAFFLELEPTPLARTLRRAAHLRILATRLIGPDYSFAARFGISHPALVWLLRPFRLLTRQL